MQNSTDIGYLHFGEGSEPRQTVSVKVRCNGADNWEAYYVGKWRRVHITTAKTFIWLQYRKITIQIEGV